MKFMGGGKRHPCDSDKRLAAIHIFINVGYIPLEYILLPQPRELKAARDRQQTRIRNSHA
jgi:hypothetical protein